MPAGQSGVSAGRGPGAVRLPGPRVSQTAFPRGPRQAGEGMGLHLLGLCLPPPKLAEHWQLSRCDPGRCHPRGPALLLPEPGTPRRRTATETRGSARPGSTEPVPGARPRRREGARARPQRRPSGAAPAGRAAVPARGVRLPRPGAKTRRREREREGAGPCQKRGGPDGPGWRGRDSPVPMAPPPRARPREGGAPRASAYGKAGGGPGRGGRRCGRAHGAPARHRRGGAEPRPPPQRGGSGQGGSVRRGRPQRCFPATVTNSALATKLTGPVGVTAPGCARPLLPPVRAGGQAPPGGAAEPIAASPGPGGSSAPAPAPGSPLPRAAPGTGPALSPWPAAPRAHPDCRAPGEGTVGMDDGCAQPAPSPGRQLWAQRQETGTTKQGHVYLKNSNDPTPDITQLFIPKTVREPQGK